MIVTLLAPVAGVVAGVAGGEPRLALTAARGVARARRGVLARRLVLSVAGGLGSDAAGRLRRCSSR